MRVVIAGATGLIGQNLIGRLLESRHFVTILTRRSIDGQVTDRPLLSYARWDGKSPGSWQEHIDGVDAIINLSGQSIASKRWTATRKQLLTSSRLESTDAIVAAIKTANLKPPVLLNASAVGYYGHVGEGDVTEEHSAGEDFLARLCVRWESAALEARHFGVRVVLLRTGVVLDPRGGALQKMRRPFKMFVGGPLGSGRQWFPWIHREDEIRAILFALQQPALSGPVNLAAPEPATMQDFSAALGKALQRPSVFTVPAFALRTLLGEMADVVLTGQRVIPRKLTQAGFKFRFPMLAEALVDLLR
jgi:uncharacterized protein (TIGR01777 family)